MKRSYKMMIATGLVVLSSTSAFALITGSKHDLSTSGGPVKDSAQTQICIFCHTPHNASQTSLLWNRTTTNISATYTMYSSTTASTTVNNAPAVDSTTTSYLCLSCHDGSIADMNTNTKNFGTLTPNLVDANAANNATKWSALYQIGAAPNLPTPIAQGSLQDDHPINFVYTTKSGIVAQATARTTLMTDNGKEPFDSNGRMQCGSCHLVHNESTAATPPGFLLRTTEAGSQLCLACHSK